VTEDLQDVLNIATRTGARYMGADRADEFGRRNAIPGELAVWVRPTKIITGFDLTSSGRMNPPDSNPLCGVEQ